MPSTPRLRTPDFSTINSPVAAKRIGVAATIRLAIKDTTEISII